MSNNIVHIESSNKDNKSFGTGFVIENNEQGTYILTCKHVLDSVQDPRIETHPIEVIAYSDFIDMAIIFLPSDDYSKMSLQLKTCNNLNITSIAFSSFTTNLIQKSTIHATLFEDFIELHSTEDDSFYLIKKIKANENYSFSKGNSGAPIICNETGNVIAMLCNKEGHTIGYALGVSSIKRLLAKLQKNAELMKVHQNFYLKMSSFKQEVNASIQIKKNPRNRFIFNIDELKKEKSTFIKSFKTKLFKLKYFLLGILTMFALYGAYTFFATETIHNKNYYEITNLPSHETLNVREGAGQGYKVVYELLPDAKQILVTRCKHNDEGTRWCRIRYGNIKGWVHSYYIKKETSGDPH
ncbi:MAG: Unknown protein [uncultured Sulfurovum sp.]|uniref:SH3b domain-containing protein n=1 Tax=uncultured Sulfurovum sp. TaxID=269237 RepID=A0A6S6SZ96_9BACT|nr:MAG: Unknown protein [uncultured Sulfurovum sp.]